MARPSKYETHVKARFDEIKDWLKLGATEKEIYKNLGISKDTWISYKTKYVELFDLIKKERQTPVEEIKAAMLKRAVGFQYEEKKVITQSVKLSEMMTEALESVGINVNNMEKPQLIRTEITTKQALPDTAASLVLLQHWDLDENGKPKWSRDPANRIIKERELELKEKQAEDSAW